MDMGSMMKIIGAWNTFKQNHPKFPAFCKAVGERKMLREDSVVEISITTPEGERIETSLKVQAGDLNLLQSLTRMQ